MLNRQRLATGLSGASEPVSGRVTMHAKGKKHGRDPWVPFSVVRAMDAQRLYRAANGVTPKSDPPPHLMPF